MDLGALEQMEIQSYFKLDKSIDEKKKSIKRLREAFYDQSMTTRVNRGETCLFSLGFRVDSNVIPLVDAVTGIEMTIELLGKKKRYLNDYLNSLEPSERDYLTHKYSKGELVNPVQPVELELYNEILEINEAIDFMYGHLQDIRNDTLPNDFNSILALLEV